MANIAMLGTGLIGMFYTMSLTAKRGRDKIVVVCGNNPDKTQAFAVKWGIPRDTVKRAVTSNAAAFLKPALDRFGIRLEEAPKHSGGVAFRDGAYVPA